MFEHSDIKFSAALPILVLLVAQPLCIFAHQSQNNIGRDDSSPPPRSPQSHFDMGPFKLEVFANRTQYQDKMRFSKSYLNFVLSSQLFGPLTSFKISRLDELVRCDNVNLTKTDMEPLLDCRPLESYVREGLHETVPKSGAGTKNSNLLYVRRMTIRAKAKSLVLGELSGRQDFMMYPMRDDVVRRNVKSILAANNLSSTDFADAVSDDYGFYVETEVPSDVFPVTCTMNIFMSFNDSILYNPFNMSSSSSSGQLSPESVMQELVDLVEEVKRDGFFVSVQDASCGRDDFFIPFSIDTDFTLALRNKFPFVTLQHNIGTKPLESLWTYTGKVTQTRDETQPEGQGDQPEAYTSELDVQSISSVFSPLSFKINQNFVKKTATSGWEKSSLAHKEIAAIVRSNWNPDIFVRLLQLYPLSMLKDGLQSAPILLIYDDEAKDEYLGLKLKLSRKFLRQLMGNSSVEEDDEDEGDDKEHAAGGGFLDPKVFVITLDDEL